MNRREFLRGSALVAFGASLGERSLFADVARLAAEGDRVLVVVFLRGAADGFSLCPPHGDQAYYDARPTIALDRPGTTLSSIVDLDGYFGLHPSLAPIKPIWDDGRLGIIHAVGSSLLGRSHFDAQEFVETGTPGFKGSAGFLARTIDRFPGQELLEAAAIARLRPRALMGPQAVMVARDLARFDFEARGWQEEAERLLYEIHSSNPTTAGKLGKDTIETIRLLRRTPEVFEPPRNGATYPDSEVGMGLQQAARLIKAKLGTRCIFVDVEGQFDTHSDQLWRNKVDFDSLGTALAGFDRDLGNEMDRTVVLVMTEFGRRLHENGAKGTDHGTAGAMLVMGGGIHGGKVHGVWPGIAPGDLYEGRDLRATTDYRDVLAELAEEHLGISEPSSLFPGYLPEEVGLWKT